MRRGLTMVEVLVTLAILSGVMIAVATWTSAASSMTAGASARTRERAAIDAALLRIAEDVRSGDFAASSDRAPPRVSLDGAVLVIRTRGEDARGRVGPVVHRYWHDVTRGELKRLALGDDGSRFERLLADEVRSASWSIEEAGEGRDMLTVRVEGVHGSVGERRFALP